MEAIGGGVRWFLRSGLRWAILAVLIGAFLWFVPQLQGEYFSQAVPAKERPALVNEYRRTWAQIIGGFGLLLGLYFTWRRVEISQDQQVTERFTRAIDQLGATDDKTSAPRLEVRLGGIYALERIAWDSPKRDYSTVVEVLTAYVRENTPEAPGAFTGSSEAASTSDKATAEAEERAKRPAAPEPRRPTADIQAILDVLGRAQDRVPEEYRTPLDLHEANLQGANLEDANLRQADLQGADLEGAYLRGARLEGAYLQRANLREADLQGAYLRGSYCSRATLQRADLGAADLQGADFQGANLQGANLREADLQGAYLKYANLRRADLKAADLQGAYLRETVFGGAILHDANLKNAEVIDEQLADMSWFLQGATMPDGQKYEHWIKEKEGSGEDVENE
jgi:hypothetical protein